MPNVTQLTSGGSHSCQFYTPDPTNIFLYHEQKQVFYSDGKSFKPGRNILPQHHRINVVGSLLFVAYGTLGQLIELLSGASDKCVLRQQLILLVAQKQLALVQKGDLVAQLFKIADYMRGYEYGVLLVTGKIKQYINYFVTHNRVKTARGLIQQKQLGFV